MRLLILLVLLLCSGSPAVAWTVRGHAIVALIAERHLSPRAEAAVQELLASEGKTSLTAVSSWADHMRHVKNPRQPSHAVYLDGGNTPYNPARHCKRDRCILAAIDSNVETLRNPSAPREARVAALKYLVHFIGDLHMPMHATRLGRGLKVVYNGKEVTLHKVWDTDVIASQKGGVRAIADLVEATATPYKRGPFTPVEWALEGRDIARDVIMPSLPPTAEGEIAVLPPSYTLEYWPIARERLNLAGRRLADLLNDIFSRG